MKTINDDSINPILGNYLYLYPKRAIIADGELALKEGDTYTFKYSPTEFNWALKIRKITTSLIKVSSWLFLISFIINFVITLNIRKTLWNYDLFTFLIIVINMFILRKIPEKNDNSIILISKLNLVNSFVNNTNQTRVELELSEKNEKVYICKCISIHIMSFQKSHCY